MSNHNPSCFGKLPFNLLETLQSSSFSNSRWLDAIEVRAETTCVTSIDTVALSPSDLPRSIAIGILHAMNDIFSANALPNWFCLSMTLPLAIDSDALSVINLIISDVAMLSECNVGKLHTMRADTQPNLTVCVGGALTGISSKLSNRGIVALGGNDATELRSRENFASAIALRRKLSREIAGPKKDVSGDGLAGSLVQLCQREMVSMELWGVELSKVTVSGDEDSTRNVLDYASAVSCPDIEELHDQLFAPRVFGPLVCLVDEQAQFDQSDFLPIGTFVRGQPKLGIIDK